MEVVGDTSFSKANMSKMIEVYFRPDQSEFKSEVVAEIGTLSGSLTYEENNNSQCSHGQVLTFEFVEISDADKAAALLVDRGFHVEGPVDY